LKQDRRGAVIITTAVTGRTSRVPSDNLSMFLFETTEPILPGVPSRLVE
jgi:hypothetical protein